MVSVSLIPPTLTSGTYAPKDKLVDIVIGKTVLKWARVVKVTPVVSSRIVISVQFEYSKIVELSETEVNAPRGYTPFFAYLDCHLVQRK